MRAARVVVALFLWVVVLLSGCRESLVAQRMREICARSPQICKDGLIVKDYEPRTYGPVLEVRDFSCGVPAPGAQAVKVTAHVKNVGDTDLTLTQNLAMTTAFYEGDSQHVRVSDSESNAFGAGVSFPQGQDQRIEFYWDYSSRSAPAITRITVSIDPGQVRQLAAWYLTLSWPTPGDPNAVSAAPLDLVTPSCSVAQP